MSGGTWSAPKAVGGSYHPPVPYVTRVADAVTGETYMFSTFAKSDKEFRGWVMRCSNGHRRRTGNGLRAETLEVPSIADADSVFPIVDDVDEPEYTAEDWAEDLANRAIDVERGR